MRKAETRLVVRAMKTDESVMTPRCPVWKMKRTMRELVTWCDWRGEPIWQENDELSLGHRKLLCVHDSQIETSGVQRRIRD